MSKEMREQINKVKKFGEFLNEDITSNDIENHIIKYNIHKGTSRDAFQGIGPLYGYIWDNIELSPTDNKINFNDLYPASKRDVNRYMKSYLNGSEFPNIVLIERNDKYIILDGAHRLQAAINLGVPIKAYVGIKK